MNEWSTLNIAMNVFSTAFELFDVLDTPELFETAMPYTLTPTSDGQLPVTDIIAPLPPGILETNYYIAHQTLKRCMITADFHPIDHLVNFCSLTFATESSGNQVINSIFQQHLPSYLHAHGFEVRWIETAKDCFLTTVDLRDVVLTTRLYHERPVAIGFAIIRRAYSGL
jgi:hypothetical protein